MSAQIPARGARRWVARSPFSARSVSMRLVTSGGSMTLNSGGSENDSACARMIWGARPGQHQERPGLVGGRPALVVVEPVKDIRRFEHEDECNGPGPAGRGPTPGEIRRNLLRPG